MGGCGIPDFARTVSPTRRWERATLVELPEVSRALCPDCTLAVLIRFKVRIFKGTDW